MFSVHFSVIVIMALLLDSLFAEPPNRYHPLVFFGNFASVVERCVRFMSIKANIALSVMGFVAWLMVVLPPVLGVVILLKLWPELQGAIGVVLLWFSIGRRSLCQHAAAIALPLRQGDLPQARKALSMIVSRDTHSLNEQQISTASIESVLENGSDSVFATIFWFVLVGPAGALLYRLANTLDAMWGYKTEQYRAFGFAAARLDDLLNYIPARLTALSYAVLGHTRQAIQCWKIQAKNWYSPNAGPVMASGAGALGIFLGGEAPYHGVIKSRPTLGCGSKANAVDITRACRLVNRSAVLWGVALLLMDFIIL
jgi:adenosylcobinamide-phosphate synthase